MIKPSSDQWPINSTVTLNTTQSFLTGADVDASSSYHYLLLLADSALPLGSFAFSSGLESYLAHIRPSTFSTFLALSLSSYSSTNLPYTLAAYRIPQKLTELDDQLDASIMCTVGRRASIAQGKALLSIWDRSLRSELDARIQQDDIGVLESFSALMRSAARSGSDTGTLPTASAHLAPLFGVVARVFGLGLEQTAYIFMLSHVKALLSAAVRASLFGPYQAQKILASTLVQESIHDCLIREWDTKVEDAGQSIPAMDLWIGRHELLYSRIFNS
jgi:urease accessory protein